MFCDRTLLQLKERIIGYRPEDIIAEKSLESSSEVTPL